MKRYKMIFFDLDGTLTDSGLGITKSVQYALNKYDIQVEDRTELYKFVGPPLVDSFMKYYHFSREQAEQADDFYHEYFTRKGMFENRVYDGVPAMLSNLNDNGFTLAVASAKPEIHVKQILHHFNLYDYFHLIGGVDKNAKRIHKDEVIHYVLSAFPNIDQQDVVMVGDRQDDVWGAKKNQIDVIGVLYGYGSRSELQTAGVDYLVETVDELRRKLTNR